MARILHLNDEASLDLIVADALSRAGHSAVGTSTVPEALQVLSTQTVDLIISDYRMRGLTGLEFLELLQREGYDIPLIMLTDFGSIEHAAAAIKAGAIDYIAKPVRAQQLELAVDRALEDVRLRRENEALRREVMEFRNEGQIVGDSPALRRILQTVAMIAPSRATVLLQGETGTGKKLFARAIHNRSDRRDRPFVTLHCTALPEGLAESALFGHERGAFTGAIKRVEGAFERAHGGTLLLDEVSALTLELQAGLLRALQEHEIERMGGTVPVRVDVRVIATTNRNLAERAATGQFRQELCDWLSVVPIEIPPLRDRPDDIATLALRFAMATAVEMGKDVTGIAPETLRVLTEYPWPGNVRELQHATERAVIMTREPVLQPHVFDSQRMTEPHLLASMLATPGPGEGEPLRDESTVMPVNGIILETLNVDEAERALIQRALELTSNNRTRAADLLGISVRTLRNKLNARPDRDEVANAGIPPGLSGPG